eukprot:CAMPEP_0173446762 /NCGR_PEP_ID=MMETSP1357-20121228/37272_1 /TAXON_ID=77926 /ORGANISM="Hemiselmis rufescens, Strain PCC563" /LENGTH=326 /DNA_ID=CAMNT_0014413091 /DNA_START=60 /DNA_END=1040 /DNA_ORIENTATION=+
MALSRAAASPPTLRMSASPSGDAEGSSRRDLLQAALLAPLALSHFGGKVQPASAKGRVRVPFLLYDDLKKLVEKDPDFGPTLVRLAWHSSGTYDKMSKTGGSSKGTIRFKEELSHGANAGLDKAVERLEPLKDKFFLVSYADLYTLAGKIAIETLGGPEIPWKEGRVDSMDPSDVTPDGRLPDADKGNSKDTASHLREIFGRMGFNDQELVALAGAHALGRCHKEASGYVGPWSPTPTMFNNAYFTLLLNLEWTGSDEKGKFQYKDPTDKLMMLPSDIVLIEDPKFKKYVELYAKDAKKFDEDFAAAFGKLLALGTDIPTPSTDPK